MLAVCGIEFAISASLDCGVPGTDARTVDFGLSKGIFAKSGGSSLPATNVHGPWSEAALEPAARDQDVILRTEAEDIAIGVLRVFETRSRYGLVDRISLGLD